MPLSVHNLIVQINVWNVTMQIIFTKQVPIRLYAVLKDITIIEPNKVVQIISIICQIRYLNVIFLELNTFKLVIHMCCNADNLL